MLIFKPIILNIKMLIYITKIILHDNSKNITRILDVMVNYEMYTMN